MPLCLAAPPPLFGLAPGGVYPAAPVARGAVRSCRTVSPLPAGRLAALARAVCFLWHFPWGRPRRPLAGTVFPWSPDFPLSALRQQRPSGRLAGHKCAEPRRGSRREKGDANHRFHSRGPDTHQENGAAGETGSHSPCGRGRITLRPALIPDDFADKPGHDVRHRSCGEGSAGSRNQPPHPEQPRERSGIGLAGDRFGAPMALERAQHGGERRIQRTLRRHAIADFAKRGAHVAQ
jgi:hypothetical protein